MAVRGRCIDRVEHDDLLAFVAGLGDEPFGFVEIALPVNAPEPASLAIGVPQVKKDGQRLQFFESPASELINSVWSVTASTARRIFTLSKGGLRFHGEADSGRV